MRQRKLIDVSTMSVAETENSSFQRPDTSKSRRLSKRPSGSSCTISRRSQGELSLSLDLRPHTTPRSSSTSRGNTTYNCPLTANSGRLSDRSRSCNGGSRVTSGSSRVALSSGSNSRSRSQMASRASSHKTSTDAFHGGYAFPDGISSQPGLTIWTLDSRRLVQVTENSHGFFHQANVYLVLQVESDTSKLIHVWLGAKADVADRSSIQSYAENLDKAVEGAGILSIENEGFETDIFLEHFQDGLVIVEGKSKTSLRVATAYCKRLYIVRGRRFPIATCAPCTLSALAADRALILDGFPRIYVWLGPEVDNVSRVKAIQVAHKLRNSQRKGIAHVIVIDKKDASLHEAFIRKLDVEVVEEEGDLQPQEEEQIEMQLYRINGDRPLYDMPFVASKPLQHKYLTSKDCFLLDRGVRQPVFIWVGAQAGSTCLDGALKRAQIFTHYNNYPSTLAVCRVMEGDEPLVFKAAFADWSDRIAKQRNLIRSYNVANIARALSSSSDCRTIAQTSELWSDDHFVTGDGVTEVWCIDNESLQARVWEQPGIFNNRCAYAILHQESPQDTAMTRSVIYYWLGCKCSEDSQKAAIEMTTALDRALQYKATIVRVLDGMETKHFLTVFQYSMLVYDGDLCTGQAGDHRRLEGAGGLTGGNVEDVNDNFGQIHASSSVNAFRVRECVPGCMNVLQVSPVSSSLNSSAAFIVYNNANAYVWYGKNASAGEREYSKSMLDNLRPDKLHQYDIVAEGKEPLKFWNLLTRDESYPVDYPKRFLDRRPPGLFLCLNTWRTFWNVAQFSQEDLNETDLYILDTFDQNCAAVGYKNTSFCRAFYGVVVAYGSALKLLKLFLWCGSNFDTRTCEFYLSVCQAYLEADLAGRHMDEVQIWIVNQGFEPELFIKYFPVWSDDGYGGSQAYELARKQARQENAITDIECQMVDRTYTCAAKLPYRDLVRGLHLESTVDIHHKEHHLTDKDFQRVLHMTRAEFYRLPEWKQTQILRSSHLKRACSAPDDAYPPVSSFGSAGSYITSLSADLNSIMRKKYQTVTPRILFDNK